MKYCPKCGALLDGKLECSCGFVCDLEEVKNNPGSNTIGVVGTGMMTDFDELSFRVGINEERLDNILKSIRDLSSALKIFKDNKTNLDLLNSYYSSKDWINDKEKYESENYKFKAGVLSEDSVWNMNEDIKDLIDELEEIVTLFK